jgi:hypothetical protein
MWYVKFRLKNKNTEPIAFQCPDKKSIIDTVDEIIGSFMARELDLPDIEIEPIQNWFDKNRS